MWTVVFCVCAHILVCGSCMQRCFTLVTELFSFGLTSSPSNKEESFKNAWKKLVLVSTCLNEYIRKHACILVKLFGPTYFTLCLSNVLIW